MLTFKGRIELRNYSAQTTSRTLHTYLNLWRLDKIPDSRYIPSTMPYSSMTAEHISNTRGISLPTRASRSPRSHPNTRSRRIPLAISSSFEGLDLKKNRKKEMNFPRRFDTGREVKSFIAFSVTSFTPSISMQCEGKNPTYTSKVNA